MPLFVIIWDIVLFHHSRLVNEWFAVHLRMMMSFFYSAWRWKVYAHRPYEQMLLLNAMTAAAQEIGAKECQGWMRHARRFFPLGVLQERILNVMWMRPCGPIVKAEETEYQ